MKRSMVYFARIGSLSLFFCFALLFAPRTVNAQDPQPPASVLPPAGASSWKLIFNDNFDGTSYDTSRWNPYADWGGTA